MSPSKRKWTTNAAVRSVGKPGWSSGPTTYPTRLRRRRIIFPSAMFSSGILSARVFFGRLCCVTGQDRRNRDMASSKRAPFAFVSFRKCSTSLKARVDRMSESSNECCCYTTSSIVSNWPSTAHCAIWACSNSFPFHRSFKQVFDDARKPLFLPVSVTRNVG